MKIIALLPVKNEAWILPTFISSVEPIVDKIIAIDDGSTDDSKKILKNAGALVIDNPFSTRRGWAEYKIRQKLLDLGREHGGTHFICIDADEALTTPFLTEGKKLLSAMSPGDRYSLTWLSLWKNKSKYRDDESVWGNLHKHVIFCDDGITNFINPENVDYNTDSGQRPHLVGPTPVVTGKKVKKIPLESGALLHYQFVNWDRFQWKQVHKRCLELIQRPSDARRINNTYRITLDSPAKCSDIPPQWVEHIQQPQNIVTELWQKNEVCNWLDDYGYEFFEPLQMWHITELNINFIKNMGRRPQSKTYPNWLIQLNGLRHRVKRNLEKN